MAAKGIRYSKAAYELRRMGPARALELFSSLSAPDLREMDGEYEATLLDQGGPARSAFNLFVLNNPLNGLWLGKAFTPSDKDTSHGYNMFWRSGRVARMFRMRTDIAPSRFDGAPAFRLTYAVYNSPCGWIRMLDEVRRVQDGLYLGIGAWGLVRKTPLPFMMQGPIGPFVGSDKDERWPLGF